MVRDRVIQIRLTQPERRLLEGAAQVRGETLTSLILGAALRAATMQTLEQNNLPELRDNGR